MTLCGTCWMFVFDHGETLVESDLRVALEDSNLREACDSSLGLVLADSE